MASLAQDVGAPVNAHGKRWRLDMGKLGRLQNTLPVAPELRCLFSITDVLKWSSSPRGINIALIEACEDPCDEQFVNGLGNMGRMDLMNRLVLDFLSDASESVTTAPGKQPV